MDSKKYNMNDSAALNSIVTDIALIKQNNRQIGYDISEVKEHLREQNSKVFQNTSFRLKALGGFVVLSFLGASSLIGIVLLWVKELNR